jgi:hypothetical protein
VTDQLAVAVGLILVALLIGASAWLVVRNWLISRHGGVVECALRAGVDLPWRQGLAVYRHGQLCWYRSVSLRTRPDLIFDRDALTIVASRPAIAGDAGWLPPGTHVVTCSAGSGRRGQPTGGSVEFGMSRGALTGYLAWLEAAPPAYLSGAS